LTVGHGRLSVMARRVRANYRGTSGGDGPDTPGHDVRATVSLFATWYYNPRPG
jgi:hypothetical protein